MGSVYYSVVPTIVRAHGGNSLLLFFSFFLIINTLPKINNTLPKTRQARRIAPEKMSIQLADVLYKVYFLERNMKLLVDYTPSWPVLNFSANVIPEILYIWLLSERLGIASPVPKLPLVNPGPGYEYLHFGWRGSIGFTNAAMLAKKLSSKQPTNIAASAVEEVLYEIEEAMSMSNSLEKGILDTEMCLTSESRPTESSSSTSTTDDLTSPMPARKNHSKRQKTDHSNKGGVGSHKLNHQKLQLTVKVMYINKYMNYDYSCNYILCKNSYEMFFKCRVY